ncbi:hypothetical protein [Luteolibacter soli]|uniref:Terminase n=1 Tax=Luteolibacter soli TaxID=3135280 RepID=A0ABU9AS23_9BACT
MATSTAITTKRGRPPKYREEYAELAMHFCRLGATNRDLARAFNVSIAGIDKWLASKPEFAAAVHEGREIADARVASALYQRAVGAVVPDTHIATHEGKTIITPLLKHYPPDTAACSLWLRNRKPELWREKTTQAVELTNGDNPYHEVAMRISAADDEHFQAIYYDELAKIEAGNPTEIPTDAEWHEESPLHALVGLGKRSTEIGTRHFTQMHHAAVERHGPYEERYPTTALEAEIIPSTPALPPERAAEPVALVEPAREPDQGITPAPEAATEGGDDFRALLGLPPRED